MNHSRAFRPQPRPTVHLRQSGFTLVEVLVSVIILSIGVLGAVGMQAAAMQSNKEVRYQAIAGALARELAEKMRGNNLIAVNIAAADNPYLLNTTLTSSSTISEPAVNCYTSTCDTGAITQWSRNTAEWDIYDWSLRLRNALPSSRVRICMDATPFTAAGLPQWACTNTGNVAVLKLAWNRSNTKGEVELTSAATTAPMIVVPLTAGSSQ